MIYHKATIAFCFLICSLIACSSSGSHTDTAVTESTSEHSDSFEELTTFYEDMKTSKSPLLSLPFKEMDRILGYLDLYDTLILRSVCHYLVQQCDITAAVQRRCKYMQSCDRRFAQFQIRFKAVEESISLKNTNDNQIIASLALKCGLVKSFQFNTLRAYKDFEEKSLLEEVFVQLEAMDTYFNFSKIDFRFVDKIFIPLIHNNASEWLKNANFLEKNWKNVHFSLAMLPPSLDDYVNLISRLNFEELVVRAELFSVRWFEILWSLDESIRKKIHIEECHFAEDLPDVASIHPIMMAWPKRSFIKNIKSYGLVRFIQERPLLKELKLRFSKVHSYQKFKRFLRETDLTSINREFRIILAYLNGKPSQYVRSIVFLQ